MTSMTELLTETFADGVATITFNRPEARNALTGAMLATHAPIYNTFNLQPHLIRRPTLRQFRAEARQEWAAATAAV